MLNGKTRAINIPCITESYAVIICHIADLSHSKELVFGFLHTYNEQDKRKKLGECFVIFSFGVNLHVKIGNNTKKRKDSNAEAYK